MAARGAFSNLLAPGLASVFFRKLDVVKNEHAQWINVESSSRAYEDELKVAGLGQLMQKGEGAPFIFDEPIQGSTKRFTHLTYGLAFRITQEMKEDDLYSVMNKMSAELAKSAAYNKDVQATTVLNNGFDSSFTGIDGIELFSLVHTRLGGGTSSNHIASNSDMDLPAVQAALENFEDTVDDQSFKVDIDAEWLVHNTGDIWTAGEILESEFIPTSADNAKNIVRSKFGIKPMHLKHLTDADAWFMIGSKSSHDMKMYMRVGDQFRNADDPFNGDAIMTARHRLSVGHGVWFGTFGSPGA